MLQIVGRLVAAASAFALMLGHACAQAPSDGEKYVYGPRMMWWDGGWYGMSTGPLFMIIVLAIVVAIAVLLVRWIAGPWQGAPTHHQPLGRRPLDILKERFARGEIDKNEYEERRQVLGE